MKTTNLKIKKGNLIRVMHNHMTMTGDYIVENLSYTGYSSKQECIFYKDNRGNICYIPFENISQLKDLKI